MAVQVPHEKKSRFVAELEGVIPQLRDRFGVVMIGIFGPTARERSGRTAMWMS
jgi:predicted nucleotidyltransferase